MKEVATMKDSGMMSQPLSGSSDVSMSCTISLGRSR